MSANPDNSVNEVCQPGDDHCASVTHTECHEFTVQFSAAGYIVISDGDCACNKSLTMQPPSVIYLFHAYTGKSLIYTVKH